MASHNDVSPIKYVSVICICEDSQYSSMGTATGYGLDGRGSIPGRVKRRFSTPQYPDRLWSPPSILSNGYWGVLSPGVKQLGREADHSTSSGAEVKNGGAIPPLPHTSPWYGA
jgi:hypothetical protein